MFKLGKTILLATVTCLGVSCANHYEYDVLQPSDHQGPISDKADVTINDPPLRFSLQTENDHLAIRIYNTTQQNITLLGPKSFIVDPTGQSRQLPTQIVPGTAFVKLILPPIRPTLITASTDSSSIENGPNGMMDGGADYNVLVYGVRDGGTIYWDWQGDAPARMSLTFQVDGKEISRDFKFGRHVVNK